MNPPTPQENPWDRSADMYNKMAEMEREYTLPQLDFIPFSPEDTVLDIGCGPGRISVPAAARVKKVTAIDTSENMMAYCRENAAKAGVANLEIRHVDWTRAVPGETIEPHDVVIACRSVGLQDYEKLNAQARKYCVVMLWANADSIPDILNELFDGAVEGRIGGPAPERDRRKGYNVIFNTAYDLGYDPSLKLFTDGFAKTFPSREAAYEYLSGLTREPILHPEVFRANADRYLTEHAGGAVTFRRETRSLVMWWKAVK